MTIKYIFWNDDTGYGTSAKQMIRGLIQAGIKVIATGLVHDTNSEYKIPHNFKDSRPYDILLIHSAPYYIERFIEPNKINIAYTTWETSVLPQNWVKVLNQCNAIFTPSVFNKQCFITSGIKVPVHVLPHISEFSGIAPSLKRSDEKKQRFTFYSVGMWTNRKNNFALIKAFKEAFNQNEPVRLMIKTSKKDYTTTTIDFLRKLGYAYYYSLAHVIKIQRELMADQRIHVITDTWVPDRVALFHAQHDCFISLCRSEGWGLGAYEAAWFGKPVIITGYGGQVDFLPKAYATLLPYQLVPIKDKVWTEYNTDGQQWADVDISAAIAAMRDAYQNQDEYKNKGMKLREFVQDQFNESRILESFVQDLSQL